MWRSILPLSCQLRARAGERKREGGKTRGRDGERRKQGGEKREKKREERKGGRQGGRGREGERKKEGRKKRERRERGETESRESRELNLFILQHTTDEVTTQFTSPMLHLSS